MLLCEQPGRTGVYATATPERISIYQLTAMSPLSHIATTSATANGRARRWGPPLAPSFTAPLARLCDSDGDTSSRAPMSLSLSCAAYEEMRFFISDAVGDAWIGTVDGTVQALCTDADGLFSSVYAGQAPIVASGWDPRNAAVLALGRRDGVVQLLDIESSGIGRHHHPPHHPYTELKSAFANVVQERALSGTVTDLDWVPLSHMTVVAARRPGKAQYYAEVMDLRSPKSGIRYLGAPRACETGVDASSAGSCDGPRCFAERVACDASQTYVAVIGTCGRRGKVQLWDLRLTSRPVKSHDCPRAEYTSLRWSPFEPLTVVATTRKGRLRLHSFTCCGSGVDENGRSDNRDNEDDEEEKQRGSEGFHPLGMGDDFVTPRLMKAGRSYANGSWLHARVPAASVAWCTDDRAGARNNVSKVQPVAMGRRADMPCLLLLNAKTGLLHPQVFSRIGSTVTIAGEAALCGVGPNVFLIPHVMEDHTNTNMNMNIKTNVSSGADTLRGSPNVALGPNTISMSGTNGEDLTALDGSSFRVSADRTSIHCGGLTATRSLLHVESSPWAVNHLDRTMRRRERLLQHFLPQSLKPLIALTHEGIDSETCALFRYGWLVQLQQHPSRQAMPATDTVPGLIEILQREHLHSLQQTQRYQQKQPPPQQQLFGIRELILRAMGWWVYRSDNSFPAPVSPASVLHASTDDALDLFPASPVTDGETTDTLISQLLEQMDVVGTASRQEAVERRAVILVCMGRLRDAAAMLSRHSDLHALYPKIAHRLLSLLGVSASASNAAQGSMTLEQVLTNPSEAGFTHWIDLCLLLAEPLSAALTPLPVRNSFFEDARKRFRQFLPLLDQIALAAALLLPPTGTCPAKEECAALIAVLQDMIQRQFRPHGSGCSLLLAAAVEGIDRECTSLQRYIDETGDVQTPICYVALYGPTGEGAWCGWNDAYRAQLNAEGDGFLRSMHDLEYIKTIRLRESENESNHNSNNNNVALCQPPGLIGVPFGSFAHGGPIEAKPPNRGVRPSVVLHCSCGQPMHTRAPATARKNPILAIAGKSRTAASSQLTPCGNPECWSGQTPICVICCERLDKRGGDGAVDKYFAWCTVCLHGGHWAHLRDWFEKHRSCPAEDCACECVYDRVT